MPTGISIGEQKNVVLLMLVNNINSVQSHHHLSHFHLDPQSHDDPKSSADDSQIDPIQPTPIRSSWPI